jgi:hypothetical protein
VTVRPSETSQGSRWLGNFRLDERRAATLLIDSLRVISSSRFRATMTTAVRNAVDELPGPVGVYPAREVPRMHNDALAPLEHPYAGTPGSEGLIGNIIRDVVGRRPRFDKAAMYNSQDELRRWRVRSLLLVDDYSGSGDQLVKYVDAWTDHPTIKSWRSYGLLRVHTLVLAASKDASQRLREHRFVDGMQYLEQGGDFGSAAWTGQEQKAVLNLCLRYAHMPAYALGYQEARGLRCYTTRCPTICQTFFGRQNPPRYETGFPCSPIGP